LKRNALTSQATTQCCPQGSVVRREMSVSKAHVTSQVSKAHVTSSKAAAVTGRIAASIPDRTRALEVQRRLRAWAPVWELAHRPEFLDALLAAAERDEPFWWRPARVALRAVAVWQELDAGPSAVDAAEAWLFGAGRPFLDLLTGRTTAVQDDGDSEPDPEWEATANFSLLRDTGRALIAYRENAPADWIELDEGVLTCLYDLASREPAELPWLVGIARRRPATAARVLLLNNDADTRFSVARPLAVVLPAAEALAFLRALDQAGAVGVAAGLSQELYRRLASRGPGSDRPAARQAPGDLAEAAVRHLYRGLAAATGGNDSDQEAAIRELESAWASGRSLLAKLLHHLGQLHHNRSDPVSALSASYLGLELTPASADLRAAAAAALNDLARHQEALDLLDAAPASQLEADYELNWQRSRALTGLGQADAAIGAASQAADLFSMPEQRHDVAQLLAGLGEEKGAAILIEQAIAGRPDRGTWYGDLGDLYASQARWEPAEGCYRQLVALEEGEELALALLRLASVQRSQGHLSGALETVTEAAHLQPKNSEVLGAWVNSAHAAGEWETAIHAGQAALALDPEGAEVHVLMGGAFEALDWGALLRLWTRMTRRSITFAGRPNWLTGRHPPGWRWPVSTSGSARSSGSREYSTRGFRRHPKREWRRSSHTSRCSTRGSAGSPRRTPPCCVSIRAAIAPATR